MMISSSSHFPVNDLQFLPFSCEWHNFILLYCWIKVHVYTTFSFLKYFY
jgi:hypothetical protein